MVSLAIGDQYTIADRTWKIVLLKQYLFMCNLNCVGFWKYCKCIVAFDSMTTSDIFDRNFPFFFSSEIYSIHLCRILSIIIISYWSIDQSIFLNPKKFGKKNIFRAASECLFSFHHHRLRHVRHIWDINNSSSPVYSILIIHSIRIIDNHMWFAVHSLRHTLNQQYCVCINIKLTSVFSFSLFLSLFLNRTKRKKTKSSTSATTCTSEETQIV